jgi:fibronectin-binding autotransporter adhesin
MSIGDNGGTGNNGIYGFQVAEQLIAWGGNATASSWTVGGNWSSAVVPSAVGRSVAFGNSGSNATADLLGAASTVGNIEFNGDVSTTIQSTAGTPSNFTLDYGTINTTRMTVNAGSHTIAGSVPLYLKRNLNVMVAGANDQLAINGSIAADPSMGLTLTSGSVGTLVLGGANTYTGATNVNAGTLIINGSTSNASAVTVGLNGTLGGTGTVGGNTTISGIHSPGNSPGIQTFTGNLSYVDAGTPDPTVNWELASNTTTVGVNPTANFDQIIVGGNLDFTHPHHHQSELQWGGQHCPLE